jgi:hypothetical protein
MENTLDSHHPTPEPHRVRRIVESLVDVEVNPKDALPEDIQVNGFDNIAGALSISSCTVTHLTPSQPRSRAFARCGSALIELDMSRRSWTRSDLECIPLGACESYRPEIFSDRGETACRHALHWRVPECADLN